MRHFAHIQTKIRDIRPSKMPPTPRCLKAQFAPEGTGENRGLMTMICPVCDKRIRERDLERYCVEAGDGTIELCPDCREDFERDQGIRLEADILSPALFAKLWAFVSDAIQPHKGEQK